MICHTHFDKNINCHLYRRKCLILYSLPALHCYRNIEVIECQIKRHELDNVLGSHFALFVACFLIVCLNTS